jgi:hypothetical protein
MSGTTIKITIPDSSKSGLLMLGDFYNYLKDISKVLQSIDLSLSKNNKLTTEYRITSLQKNSPAEVELEPVPIKGSGKPNSAKTIVKHFVVLLENVNNKESLNDCDEQVLENLYTLAKANSKLTQPSEFAILEGQRTKKVPFMMENEAYLKDILSTEVIVGDFVQGYLKRINIHQKREFVIYPLIGAKRIRCAFKPAHLETVKQGIGRYVEIVGKVHYRKNEYFPCKVEAEQIEIYPPQEEIPPLSSFQGILENITDGVDHVDYVRALRDEE